MPDPYDYEFFRKMQEEADKAAADALWLVQHPQFEEKPASIREFLGPRYLNIEHGVRPGIKQALVDLFGEEPQADAIALFEEAMVTGAIGIGKSTYASIVLPYMVHWVLCLKDPQGYFSLLPGSRIAFMMMSTSEKQAKEVIFGDVFARLNNSPWFKEEHPYDPTIKSMVRWPDKDIWILPGDSKETTFEGYNILGGVIDEADSHLVTMEKDYAEEGYHTIRGRITSRFGKRGLLIIIGQMKKANGFAAKQYYLLKANPRALVVRMTIWESLGWEWDDRGEQPFLKPDGTHDSFFYDYRRRQIVPPDVAKMIAPHTKTLLEIPTFYLRNFQTAPEKSLKDLAGIPPATNSPFISLVDRIEDARNAWIKEKFPDVEIEEGMDLSQFSPVDTSSHRPSFYPWFHSNGDTRRRAMHIDIAYSGEEDDALGMAMGHISGITVDEEDGEEKPIICIDFLLRIKAPKGTEIMLSDVRRIIYHVRDDLGFRVKKVTYDGFESTESVQALRKKRFEAEKVSIDKNTLPYEDVREAIYSRRLLIPPYITEYSMDKPDLIEIAVKELSELQDTGKKIDHPPGGSKDISDTIAGVTFELMGDRRYRRGVVSIDVARRRRELATGTDSIAPQMTQSKDPFWGAGIPRMPSVSDLGLIIPDHMRRPY